MQHCADPLPSSLFMSGVEALAGFTVQTRLKPRLLLHEIPAGICAMLCVSPVEENKPPLGKGVISLSISLGSDNERRD